MAETCLKKFQIGIEVADFICYLKYINKKNEDIHLDLVDSLYELVTNNPNVSKNEIAKLINLYTHQLAPSMLQERKFDLYYNSITNKLFTNVDDLSDTYNSPFVIHMNTDIVKRFNKDEFMNHFTDTYPDLFLLDIRYYGIERKYYEVSAEIYLSEEALTLKSNEPEYVNYLLAQYNMNEIVEKLGLSQKINHQGNILTTENSANGTIEDVYGFNQETVLDQLVECYETSSCVFINNVFLKTFNINMNGLLQSQNVPKLIFVLEQNEYDYFDKTSSNQIDRIEKIDNNTIVHISEHLFRQSSGYSSYILMMNDKYHITLNQLNEQYFKFPFIAKYQNKNLDLFRNILTKYLEHKRLDSYIENLLLWIFILEEEELNSNLNYYLVSSLKTSALSSLRFYHDSRESLPLKDLKKLLQVVNLAKELSKTIELNSKNIKLILNDMLNMIRKLNNLEEIVDFESVVEDVQQTFNINDMMFEEDLTQLKTLISVKRLILTKEQDIKFILDTSVLMDEPDLFQKYFNDKSIIVPSIIRDELENMRVNNINAVRAIRNINLLRNDPTFKIQYINGEEIPGGFNKHNKIKIFEDLINQFSLAGKRPILVSNDMSHDLYDNNKDSMIQLKHLQLLFK